jgi:uncharacterized damage-inducible protein DinB
MWHNPFDFVGKEILMDENILTRLFEHNNWANLQLIQTCATLTDEQLDAQPQTATKGSIRSTLQHLINSQEDYGYSIEPWVVMVQAINHATEHREQIKSMLSSLGITPPRIDGWAYGKVTNALIQLST